MTNEEAIKGMKRLAQEFSGYKPNEEMFEMAIKALEQQFINKPCVSEEACYEDKMKVLDKVREEIEIERQDCLFAKEHDPWWNGKEYGLSEAIEIIDKYRKEQE